MEKLEQNFVLGEMHELVHILESVCISQNEKSASNSVHTLLVAQSSGNVIEVICFLILALYPSFFLSSSNSVI